MELSDTRHFGQKISTLRATQVWQGLSVYRVTPREKKIVALEIIEVPTQDAEWSGCKLLSLQIGEKRKENFLKVAAKRRVLPKKTRPAMYFSSQALSLECQTTFDNLIPSAAFSTCHESEVVTGI